MSGLLLPIGLIFAGIITAIVTYRGIRRGGARFYTLEREALLRRASFTLFSTVVLFLAASGILIFERQQSLTAETPAEGEVDVVEGETAVPGTPEINSLPPLSTETPTPDASIPTATPTVVVCSAIVEGTFDNGLTLRDAPGGAEVDVLAEATIVTVLTEEGTSEANGFVWRKVRSLFGDEGWVAEDFLTFGTGCN
ncbi:MAG: SH3 domain-containing protein [Chloroflexi bacterium]|nr:MAG: SH3 domain-containing protein [Chloroflexota bacterium]